MTTFEFGPFRLDPSDRQLLRAGLPVALPPKVFDALHLLVERRGRLVGKEELMATLWPEAIVEEVTLARMISSLRKVLGDSPSARSYIETVSKFGYRFVAAVAEFDAAPALGSVAVHFTVRLPAGVHPARFPTAGSMALSPDGSLLALVATQHGRPALWVRDLAALEAVPLAGTEGAASPFWAPDGRDIAFFANGTLRRTSRRGGHVATLCEAPFGNAGTWGADDVLLFTEWAGGREGLYRISSSGGTPQRLSLHGTAGPERGIAWPAFLPDGRRFVYLGGALGAGNDGGPVRMIGVGSLDSSLITHLGPADSQPLPIAGDRLVFAREGRVLMQCWNPDRPTLEGEPVTVVDLVWYLRASGSAELTVSLDGRSIGYRTPPAMSRLVWLDRQGRETGTIGHPAHLDAPRLSPARDRIAMHIADPRAGGRDIWVHDLKRDIRSRCTFDPLDAIFPQWCPEGERLLFSRVVPGGLPPQMRIKRLNVDAEDEAPVQTPGVQLPQDWSRDGAWILFADNYPTRRPQRKLWLLACDGSGRVQPFRETPAGQFDGRFSPDGDCVAFVSDESGRPEVYLAPMQGNGRCQQVSAHGGTSPVWAPDGRALYFISGLCTLTSVAIGADPVSPAGEPVALFEVPGWSHGWTMGGMDGPRFDVAANGDQFLFASGSPEAPPITLMTGWAPTA